MSRSKKEEPVECTASMESRAQPGHTHRCGGTHDGIDHMCTDPACRRWFGGASVVTRE